MTVALPAMACAAAGMVNVSQVVRACVVNRMAPLFAAVRAKATKNLPHRYAVDQLREVGTLTDESARLVDAVVGARLAFLVTGGTGSGKTTLLNLIPRFFDISEGHLFVDGVDVREQSLEHLWGRLGVVPQRAYLFSGTVASNLRFGKEDATDEELWHALEVAQARDFVEAMPGGLNAPIDQGGTNVSGGQRQRLAIARALVKRPAVYLFDDCFSALDAGTDARLRAALRGDTRDATVLIVAQRVSTIMHADRIVVLDEGRVEGVGTHEELMVSSEPYREIVDSQLGEAVA